MSTILLSVFVLLTNRWLSYDDGISIMMADDIQSYMSIARSAPALPGEPLPFHHAQRLAVPYAIGLAAKAVPLSHQVWFTLVTLLCFAMIVGVYLKILARLSTTGAAQFVLLSLLILNP